MVRRDPLVRRAEIGERPKSRLFSSNERRRQELCLAFHFILSLVQILGTNLFITVTNGILRHWNLCQWIEMSDNGVNVRLWVYERTPRPKRAKAFHMKGSAQLCLKLLVPIKTRSQFCHWMCVKTSVAKITFSGLDVVET
jgi:hypothetical protein